MRLWFEWKISLVILILFENTVFDPVAYVKGDSDNEFKLLQLQCFQNPVYVKDAMCKYRFVNHTTKVVSGHLTIYRQHGDYYTHLTVFRRPSYTPGGWVKLIDLKNEFCKHARGDRVNAPLMKLAEDVVIGQTNYPLRCPIPPGFYYMNETDYDAKSVPYFLPTGHYRVIVDVVQISDGSILSYYELIAEVTSRRRVAKKL